MNLLPNKAIDFSTKGYWEAFFRKRGNKSFEWYGTWIELCATLSKYVKSADDILVVGCGNSKLSIEMHQTGYRKITNIDISEVVIEKMKKSAPNLQWIKMDATKMEFEDGQFSVVLDKGTLDALLTDESDTTTSNVDQMFKEIERVLKFGGRYICISLLQEHILRKILNWFLERGWMVRICRNFQEETDDKASTSIEFPVFVVVCTKLKPMAGLPINTFLELALTSDAPKKSSVDDALNSVGEIQRFAMLRNKISNSSVCGENFFLDLFKDDSTHPRYTLYIVDLDSAQPVKFAIFIVPNGREIEWLFVSLKGREQLAEMCQCQRLIVVHLNRNHTYVDLEQIKSELSAKVMVLAPRNYNPKMMVQFLSVGEEIGRRTVLCRRMSEINGEIIVEDVESENKEIFRRLIFLNSSDLIQSDARLVPVKSKKRGKTKLQIDHSYLTGHHPYFLMAGLSFLPQEIFSQKLPFRVLVVGLGGGSFPRFLHCAFTNCYVDVVELDPCVVDVAKEFFDLKIDERITAFVDDGLKFIAKCPENQYDVLVIDVFNNDVTIGMNGPPQAFVEKDMLTAYKKVFKDEGLLILNLCCRDEQMKAEVIARLCDVFETCYSMLVPEQVNEIIYLMKRPSEGITKDSMEQLNTLIKSNIKNSITLTEFQSLVDSFNNLDILKSHHGKN